MRVSREFKLGILVVLSFLLIFIGFNFLKSFATFWEVRQYSVEFDKSYGLEVGDDVQLHGVRVGEVTGIDLHYEDATRVVVHFEMVDEDLDIPKETQLWLISSDIFGTKVLDLRIPPDSILYYPDSLYASGDFFNPDYVKVALALDEALEAQFLPIKEKTQELIRRVEDIAFKVNAYWDNSGAYNFDASMYNVRDAIDRYKEMTSNLSVLIKRETIQASLISEDMKKFQKTLDKDSILIIDISNDFADITNTFDDPVLKGKFNESSGRFVVLDTLFSRMGRGNGSVGKWTKTKIVKTEIDEIDTALTKIKWHIKDRSKDFYGFSIFGLRASGYQPDKDKKKLLDGLLDSLDNGKKIDYE